MIKFFIAVLALLSFSALVSAKSLSPVVNTPLGPVQGWDSENTAGIYSFKGIPYAQPPVGNLRFADTVPANAWNSTLNATVFSAGCIGHCNFPRPSVMCPKTTSEDCLYLNVFTPSLNPSEKLDVLLFIHGGTYQYGAGGVPLYDGSALASNQNVVVVTTNYRLGIFGGLYTGRLRGNYQIKDQREAMKWIQKNIAVFGGNPNSVTISGQSAGAFSVTTHMTSPKSWPYFQKAFSISNPLGLMAMTPELALELGNMMLKNVSCPESGSDAQLECLRAVPAETLLLASDKRLPALPSQAFMMMMEWVPVVDGDELPNQPITSLTTGQFNRVPFLATTVANESIEFIYGISSKPLDKLGVEVLMSIVLNNETLVEAAIKEYGPIPDLPDLRNWISPMVTDLLFYCPWRYAGRAVTAAGNPMYEWLYDLQNSTWNSWTYGTKMPYCAPKDILCHAINLAAVFNPISAFVEIGVAPPTVTPEEKRFITMYQTAIANFMKTGNPNAPRGLPVKVPVMDKTGIQVNMTENISLLNNYRGKHCDFWDRAGYRRF